MSYGRPPARKGKRGNNGKARKDATPDDGMGAGRSLTQGEDDALADSVLAVRQNNIVGTDQSGTDLWEKLMAAFRTIREQAGADWAKVKRSLSELHHRWKLMANGIHQFNNAYSRVCSESRTGNVFEKNIFSLTVATRVSADLYIGVRADRAQDVKVGRTRKRKAKVANFEFCRRVAETAPPGPV